MNLKDTILGLSQAIGFQTTVIGNLEPMDAERAEFIHWLSQGYAAGMSYLKRNPHFRASPQLLHPQAKSAIVVSASYYTEAPDSPGPTWGRVARYAVGLDYHAVLRAKLRELKSRIEEVLGRPLLGKAYTDDVALLEQKFASRSGLGFAGKNTLIIAPRLMGSYNFVAELFTDLELAHDQPYRGTCGACFRCGDVCPTDAIVDAGVLNAGLCLSYLTIENKDGIPLELRPKLGEWVFGCDLCQEVCPYNQRPPTTPWREFFPESGTGHHLELTGLLNIKSDQEFLHRFKHTALRRPKRRGLLRNALVVLGNRRPERAFRALASFAEGEPDPMLREHAGWAIAQYHTLESRRTIEALYTSEVDPITKGQLSLYLT